MIASVIASCVIWCVDAMMWWCNYASKLMIKMWEKRSLSPNSHWADGLPFGVIGTVTSWMLVSQTFKKYLNGSVQVAECHAGSPSPPLRPLALLADWTRCLPARTYLSIHSSSVTSIIATGGKGLNYWVCNKSSILLWMVWKRQTFENWNFKTSWYFVGQKPPGLWPYIRWNFD